MSRKPSEQSAVSVLGSHRSDYNPAIDFSSFSGRLGRSHWWGIAVAVFSLCATNVSAAEPSRMAVESAMQRAVRFFHGEVALRGGYVYYYSPDFSRRLGEGVATDSEIWVQPPGTPAVGMAFLDAWRATGDQSFLDAAHAAGQALVYGQLASGAWQNAVDFDPDGRNRDRYRNGRGGGERNYSTLDDNISQSAIRFLLRLDHSLAHSDERIAESLQIALDALLAAQFPNGGFPQVWSGPVERQPLKRAVFPEYDWRAENRIKEYWNLYTLNDGLAGNVADVLIDAHRLTGESRYLASLARLGDFLLLAQLPEPQPAWAQQYDYEMRPVWARKFEPPAVAGRESQDAIETLLKVYWETGDEKYLDPIPGALKYLESSRLPNGQLARYHELKTNRPLYMTRDYRLTYDDREIPDHYGWKTEFRGPELQRKYAAARAGWQLREIRPMGLLRRDVERVVNSLDDQGRWMSTYGGELLVGQPKFRDGEAYLSSAVFSRNLSLLSDYLQRTR